MSQEIIDEELNTILLQYSKINEIFSPDSLRYLQQSFGDLGQALEREIQSRTLTDMVQVAHRMENLEELFPQEIAILGMWLVGGGERLETSDGVYKESTQALMKIMKEIQSLRKGPLTTENLGILQGMAQEASRLTKMMTERQEHQDRLQKFERAIKSLSLEDRQFLTELLKSKIESVCYSSV